MSDLALVSTDDLMDELLNRSDHGVITLMHVQSDQQVAIKRKWKGNTHTIVGLAVDLQRCALADFHKTAEDESTDWEIEGK